MKQILAITMLAAFLAVNTNLNATDLTPSPTTGHEWGQSTVAPVKYALKSQPVLPAGLKANITFFTAPDLADAAFKSNVVKGLEIGPATGTNLTYGPFEIEGPAQAWMLSLGTTNRYRLHAGVDVVSPTTQVSLSDIHLRLSSSDVTTNKRFGTLFYEVGYDVTNNVYSATKPGIFYDAGPKGTPGNTRRLSGSSAVGVNEIVIFGPGNGLNGSEDAVQRFIDERKPFSVKMEVFWKTILVASKTISFESTQTSLPPTVAISAESFSIESGKSTTIQWASTEATSATLQPGFGAVTTSGSVVVSPSVTTTYIITVTNSAGSATKTVTITVTAPPPPPPAPLVNIVADETSIISGKSTTLRWTTSNTLGRQIAPGIGSVAEFGSMTIGPTVTTTYTLTGTNSLGVSASANITITVTAPPPPPPAPTGLLTASRLTITEGESTILSWSTTNATFIAMSPWGEVDKSGSVTVTPRESTLYTLDFLSPAGTNRSSVQIIVQPKAPPAGTTQNVRILATLEPITEIKSGDKVTLKAIVVNDGDAPVNLTADWTYSVDNGTHWNPFQSKDAVSTNLPPGGTFEPKTSWDAGASDESRYVFRMRVRSTAGVEWYSNETLPLKVVARPPDPVFIKIERGIDADIVWLVVSTPQPATSKVRVEYATTVEGPYKKLMTIPVPTVGEKILFLTDKERVKFFRAALE